VPRWAALAALPLLVGAVLLMHGLDAHAGAPATSSTAVEHHHDSGAGHDRSCDSCPGPHHVLVVCLAVVAAIGTCRATRHLTTVRAAVPAARCLASRARFVLADMVRPPDPAWVRLSVMRC